MPAEKVYRHYYDVVRILSVAYGALHATPVARGRARTALNDAREAKQRLETLVGRAAGV